MQHKIMRKWTRLCAAGALMVLVSCDAEVLEVANPNAIQLEFLEDVTLLDVQLSGVKDRFTASYSGSVMDGANFLTDEMLTGLNWEDWARVNHRVVSYLEGPTTGLYEGMSKPLRMGHDLSLRIKGWMTEYPEDDFEAELAETLVYTGYSAMMLGEFMCQCVVSPDPDEPSGTILSQLETFAVALPYFEEALSMALSAGESDIANLARTGLARTHLGLGNWAQAATYANQVEVGFTSWIDFIDVSGGRNPLQGSSHGGNFTTGISPFFTGTHPSFDGTGLVFGDDDIVDEQTDPRIQHWPEDDTGHNGATRLYKVFQGLRFSDYTGNTLAPTSAACPTCTGTDEDDMELLADYNTNIILADYTEAQHHYYEALAMQGISTAEVLAFVNARRAVGNQAPVALAGQALITELRNQRGKDTYMGGNRLADLRRWTRFDPGNGPFAAGSYFPTGDHPNENFGAYGEWTCFPIPLQEYEGNENLTKPINPDTPPGI
jgi:hypothetical protein